MSQVGWFTTARRTSKLQIYIYICGATLYRLRQLRAMFPRKRTNLIVAALSLCIVFTSLGPVALAQ